MNLFKLVKNKVNCQNLIYYLTFFIVFLVSFFIIANMYKSTCLFNDDFDVNYCDCSKNFLNIFIFPQAQSPLSSFLSRFFETYIPFNLNIFAIFGHF